MLGSRNYVVHSYAANALERILVVRDGQSFKYVACCALCVSFMLMDVYRVGRADIAPLLGPMLTVLFQAMEQPMSKENDFLMKGMLLGWGGFMCWVASLKLF